MGDAQKALFDACMKQVEYFGTRWDVRKTYEWKTTIAVWTLAVGGIYFVKKPQLISPWAIGAFVFVYAFLWLKRVWDANDVEVQHMIFYQREADAIMRDPSHVLGAAPPFTRRPFYNIEFLGNWSMQFQLLSVILLAYLFYAIPRSN